MKERTFILTLLMCLLCSATVHSINIYPINVNEKLLKIAQRYFPDLDADYYLIDDNNTDKYRVFVDAMPLAGWQHPCYYVNIPNPIPTNIDYIDVMIEEDNMPPYEDLIPLSVKDRYTSPDNSPPFVEKVNIAKAPGTELSAAQRTYAIILSGGVNKNANHERYWNDCSFLYQTLVNKYGIPKDHIFPLMSDGTNPEEDMKLAKNETNKPIYISQPLDLDFDGEADIKLAATKNNIALTLERLSNIMQKDDHLFFYVIDHGGRDDDGDTYICLWNSSPKQSPLTKIYPFELSNMLEPFTSKLINVNVVLGQCFSGGFINDLRKVGCVVATASTAKEESMGCFDIVYDEFVYQWTCAINGANHLGKKLKDNPDTDGNNRVTMKEAFIYATTHDRYKGEHPQYMSTPVSVGEDLAFNHLAPAVDIYIKDNAKDTGKMPNVTTEEFWQSPSICVRNQPDGIFEHQNPFYASNHPSAYVYVRVHNRGKEKYTGGKSLQVYWGHTSTTLSTATWSGLEKYTNTSFDGIKNYVTGGSIGIVPINEINPGEYRDVRINWALPSVIRDYPNDQFHFCLLAKIIDEENDKTNIVGQTNFDVLGDNNIAQLSSAIINKKDFSKGCNVFVRNTSSDTKFYSLELCPRTDNDSKIFSHATIEVELSPTIYNAWGRGGYKSYGIQQASTTDQRTYRITTSLNKFDNICLYGKEFDTVKLNFCSNSINYGTKTTEYTLDLIQKDNSGNIVGGTTLVVTPPNFYNTTLGISSTPMEKGEFQLSINNNDLDSAQWSNSKGIVLGNCDTITVMPTMDDNTYSVKVMDEEGDFATDHISLASYVGIKTISYTGGKMEITLHSSAPENATLSISSLTDMSHNIKQSIPYGTTSTSIDISNLPCGLYVINYFVNEELIDQQKINI